MIISKLVPRKIVSLIKAKDQLPLYAEKIENIKKSPNNYVYLLGTPNHANMGDHLIAAAEIQYLQNEFGMNVMDIPTEMYHIYRKTLKKSVPCSCNMFITGGGWMGDVWPIEERTLENMAFDFKNNPTLVFPQTIFYLNPEIQNKVSKRAEKIFNRCKKLVICVRDQYSYNYGSEHYNNELILCPDIALYYQKKLSVRLNAKKKIGICFREDREKVDHATFDDIKKKFEDDNVEFIKLSTISKSSVSYRERTLKIDHLIEEFHNCDLVITDRLHGMIYAFLASSPCIVFDNLTHKVSGVYTLFLKESPYVEIMSGDNDLNEILMTAHKLLDMEVDEKLKLDTSIGFEKINEVIKSWLK